MKIGLIKEIKVKEGRVGLTPAGVAALCSNGHQVFVQYAAGVGAGFSDEQYHQAGATLCDCEAAWAQDLVVKVKEPVPAEYGYLQQQLVFTYFHLAGVDPALTTTLCQAKTTAIAYETLQDAQGRLPLLAPMSAVAGNMAVQMAAHYLAAPQGGKGVMLGSVLGKRHGEVLVIGDGVVGRHAAQTAMGLGANVSMAGLFLQNAPALQAAIGQDLQYFYSEPAAIAKAVQTADVVVGAVLAPGARAEHVVTTAMVQSMQPGSVLVDVSIDQGGCIETSKITTHEAPVFTEHGVLHYCVGNMPGAYPRTATLALTDATLPYVLQLADLGLAAVLQNPGLAKAVNTYNGYITCEPVATALQRQADYRALVTLLA